MTTMPEPAPRDCASWLRRQRCSRPRPNWLKPPELPKHKRMTTVRERESSPKSRRTVGETGARQLLGLQEHRQ